MSYTVKCSYGEIIDKHSILKIKESKAVNDEQKNNILTEMNELAKYIHNDDPLFDDLFKINKKLWVLEDLIRMKSEKKEFDELYIDCAEKIHFCNDERYSIKKKINIKYGSEIKEEKILNGKMVGDTNESKETKIIQPKKVSRDVPINAQDAKLIHKYMELYNKNKIKNTKISYDGFKKLIEKYKINGKMDKYYGLLYFSFSTCEISLGLEPLYLDQMEAIYNTRHIFPDDFVTYITTSYCRVLLHVKDYSNKDLGNCLKYLQPVSNPNKGIAPNTITHPTENKNQLILIYSSGGIGDILMNSRFLPEYCEKFSESKIYYLVDDRTKWIFEDVFQSIKNLFVTTYREMVFKFDYHFNVTELFYVLGKNYCDICNDKYLSKLTIKDDMSLCNAIDKTKKNIVINWHGNARNCAEVFRKINLRLLKKLFDIKTINWISVQKEVSKEEKNILKSFGVTELSDVIDSTKCYYDTIRILQDVDYVISIDSSLLHLAGSMDVKTIGLLNKGCDWRWTYDKTSNWYPNVTLLRQEKNGDWSSVIDQLYEIISNL